MVLISPTSNLETFKSTTGLISRWYPYLSAKMGDHKKGDTSIIIALFTKECNLVDTDWRIRIVLDNITFAQLAAALRLETIGAQNRAPIRRDLLEASKPIFSNPQVVSNYINHLIERKFIEELYEEARDGAHAAYRPTARMKDLVVPLRQLLELESIDATTPPLTRSELVLLSQHKIMRVRKLSILDLLTRQKFASVVDAINHNKNCVSTVHANLDSLVDLGFAMRVDDQTWASTKEGVEFVKICRQWLVRADHRATAFEPAFA